MSSNIAQWHNLFNPGMSARVFVKAPYAMHSILAMFAQDQGLFSVRLNLRYESCFNISILRLY